MNKFFENRDIFKGPEGFITDQQLLQLINEGIDESRYLLEMSCMLKFPFFNVVFRKTNVGYYVPHLMSRLLATYSAN